MVKNVFLSLGSNLGDRFGYLQFAYCTIEKRVGSIVGISSVYESVPWGYSSNNIFYNQVLQLHCNVKPLELLYLIQQIEKEAGRKQLLSYYIDRTLDIDILFYGNDVVSMPTLTIPHPHIANRRFVLEPMCELASDFMHPVLKLTLYQLLLNCKDTIPIRKLTL